MDENFMDNNEVMEVAENTPNKSGGILGWIVSGLAAAGVAVGVAVLKKRRDRRRTEKERCESDDVIPVEEEFVDIDIEQEE